MFAHTHVCYRRQEFVFAVCVCGACVCFCECASTCAAEASNRLLSRFPVRESVVIALPQRACVAHSCPFQRRVLAVTAVAIAGTVRVCLRAHTCLLQTSKEFVVM